MSTTSYWIYILACANGTYYTGYTTDLARRWHEHMAGTSKSKYTRSFKPRAMIQCWLTKKDLSEALKIEKYIKSLTRKAKLELIAKPNQLINRFSCRVLTPKQIAKFLQ